MLNVYDYITNTRYFKTYKVDDLLFVEYKCRLRTDRVSYWTHNNYFAYILGGRTVSIRVAKKSMLWRKVMPCLSEKEPMLHIDTGRESIVPC
ncbi:MAG: hypothetical protein WEB30_16655 [Cyclobacteriaceae bacterium]